MPPRSIPGKNNGCNSICNVSICLYPFCEEACEITALCFWDQAAMTSIYFAASQNRWRRWWDGETIFIVVIVTWPFRIVLVKVLYVGFNHLTNIQLNKFWLVINSIIGTFTCGLLQYSVHAPLLRVLRSLAWKLSRFSIPSSIVSTTEAAQEFLGILTMAISHSAPPSRSRQARKFGTTMALKATKNVCANSSSL